MTFLPSSQLVDNSINANRCLGYAYTCATANYTGFLCPFSMGSVSQTSMITMVGLNYPNQAGVLIPPNTYAGWSDNTGLM